jgi:hypothetical protein
MANPTPGCHHGWPFPLLPCYAWLPTRVALVCACRLPLRRDGVHICISSFLGR